MCVCKPTACFMRRIKRPLSGLSKEAANSPITPILRLHVHILRTKLGAYASCILQSLILRNSQCPNKPYRMHTHARNTCARSATASNTTPTTITLGATARFTTQHHTQRQSCTLGVRFLNAKRHPITHAYAHIRTRTCTGMHT